MTPHQEEVYNRMCSQGYSYYDERHGNIILSRPFDEQGHDYGNIRVSINRNGKISEYKGEKL